MYSAFQNLRKTLNAPDLDSVQISVTEKIKETEDLKNKYEELLRKYALAIGSNVKKNLVLLEDRTIKKRRCDNNRGYSCKQSRQELFCGSTVNRTAAFSL